jgi:hypothetical protein
MPLRSLPVRLAPKALETIFERSTNGAGLAVDERSYRLLSPLGRAPAAHLYLLRPSSAVGIPIWTIGASWRTPVRDTPSP